MATPYTSSIFSSTYRDDYVESDGYHRVLFNSGRALQAREATQLQTIIQQEITRFGRNIFKEGAAVNPGGLTVNNQYEFIKLAAATVLPSDITTLVGTTFTGQTSGVKAKVLEVVDTEGSDPPTLYVTYTDTTSGTSGVNGIRMSAAETIDNGTYSYAVQTTNTAGNPAIGRGTRVSFANGDFFTQGRFVFAPAQSKIVAKYSSTPTTDVGFIVQQDIVSAEDNSALYDNQNATPNFSAPGADRYRIQLIATTRALVDSDETFVYVARLVDGEIVDKVEGNDDYNKINELLALRTKEESGNYNVKPFIIKFEDNDSDATVLDLNISDGISYINGFRAAINFPSTIQVSKAQDTVTLNNEVVAANYGNYVVASAGTGVPNIDDFESWNLNNDSGYAGSTIGTARVRAVEEDGADYRLYLFDIQMNSGQSFRNVKSIGASASSFNDIILEAGKAALKETADNNLLFPLPTNRPQSLSDISLTVQRRFSTTTDGAGAATLTLTATGETFANTNDWIVAEADGAYETGVTITGAGTASASLSGGPISSGNLEVLAYVNKSAGASRTKTLNETTKTGNVLTDANGTQYLSLGVADIYDVSRVRLDDSDGADVSNRFTLDTGQRDNFYGVGRLVLRGGQTAPTGPVFTRYRHFSHGTSGDFFSVNSYTGQVDYADIPSHRTNAGEVIQLRDVLDFRPIYDSDTEFASGDARVNELPQNTDLITTDVVYYQPRYSKLVVNTSGNISVISGPSSLTPILPPTPENALHLYNIKLNAFTLNDSDMTIEKIETKRYTMNDIGRLEDRLNKLEELTTLSLLELDTANFAVLDSTGNNRTKSGFLVDNFKDHTFANTTSAEYKASIDPDARIMRPGFWTENVRLIYDSDLSTGTILKGDNVFFKYDHVTQIDQNLATGTENVNPFAVITNRGTLTLSPASDDWAEQRRIPARVIDGDAPIARNLGLAWNNWLWNWAGRRTGGLNENVVGSSSSTTSLAAARGAGAGAIAVTTTIREVIGDRVVDIALIPFMRSIRVNFKAEGCRPNTRMFPYFDGVDVSAWCRSSSFTRFSGDTTQWGNTRNRATGHPQTSSTLVTDDEGTVEGTFFIPNTNLIKFRTGSREFTLLDVSAFNPTNALSIASEIFTARGVIETRQADIVSTRRTQIVRPERESRSSSRRQDPLAQSFFVEDINGIFITKVDVRFATKDDTIPVQMQIRPMVNGVPASYDIVPGASKFLPPSSVNVSADASAITTFEFDEPIFLAPLTEYCVVLLAESVEYNVYVAETEQFLIGSTEQRVTKQPTMGSLFKSQNGFTWTADQTKDLTFKTYRADFASTAASVVLENAEVPVRLLEIDPITTDSGSSTVTIFHENHGLNVGDTVTLDIDSATSVGGISGTSLLGDRTITAVDWTGYQFVADSSSTSNAIGGGDAVTATQNVLYDIFVPSISTLVPNTGTASYSYKATSGKSFAGTETPYQKDASYTNSFVFENNIVASPRLIANTANETSELGAGVKSLTFKVDLTTQSTKVAPYIDLQRSSMFLINNVIDRQDSAATSGFNVPLSFVNETDPTGGSALAKHLTVPVTLEEDAVGLKVLLAANRPSDASIAVYYRTADEANIITDQSWVLTTVESPVPSDENVSIFREYEYLIGGPGGALTPFTQFQIKVVMNSTNSSKVPVFRDLRVIALSV